MVKNAFSLTGNGLRDWLIQRISAVILAAYFIFLLGFFVLHPDLDYIDWSELFSLISIRFFTLLALIALILHSWVGVWTVATDYIKPTPIRITFHTIVICALFIYLFWGLAIVFKWSLFTWG